MDNRVHHHKIWEIGRLRSTARVMANSRATRQGPEPRVLGSLKAAHRRRRATYAAVSQELAATGERGD